MASLRGDSRCKLRVNEMTVRMERRRSEYVKMDLIMVDESSATDDQEEERPTSDEEASEHMNGVCRSSR